MTIADRTVCRRCGARIADGWQVYLDDRPFHSACAERIERERRDPLRELFSDERNKKHDQEDR